MTFNNSIPNAQLFIQDGKRSQLLNHLGIDLKNIDQGSREEKIKRIAVQFEEMLISTLLKSAFPENESEELFSGSMKTTENLRLMYLSQYIADSGGLGYQKLIEEQIKSKINEIPDTAKAAENPLSSTKPPINYYQGNPPPMIAPVHAPISSGYGWRNDPIDGKLRFHSGIDLEIPINTPIKAMMAGEVIFSGFEKGYGRMVELRHANGMISRYAHNAKLLVKPGEWVDAGSVISLSGNSGRSTGPHLHFEISKNNQSLDPTHLFSK
jgi:murein DD-endopeptidase MepM/ murein hydrolase activator NlpD